MKDLPSDVNPYKRTPLFTQNTIPKGLLKAHSTKENTWGKICVTKGKLIYVIELDPFEIIELSQERSGVVEPQVPHHVETIGDVEFYVEFYK